MPRNYQPPAMNRRIIIRDPDDQVVDRDDIGRIISESYPNEIETWAARRDRTAFDTTGPGLPLIRAATVVFTVRRQSGITPNSFVVDDGVSFPLTGAPLERGMKGGGATHLELYTERLSGAAT